MHLATHMLLHNALMASCVQEITNSMQRHLPVWPFASWIENILTTLFNNVNTYILTCVCTPYECYI
jgi:hypothetical protein